MFEAICNHLKYATNKGKLRSAITIFRARNSEDPSKDFKYIYKLRNKNIIFIYYFTKYFKNLESSNNKLRWLPKRWQNNWR